jgi:hypothetical protein
VIAADADPAAELAEVAEDDAAAGAGDVVFFLGAV